MYAIRSYYAKGASGAALGVIGIASYMGAGIQDILSGQLIGDSKTVTNVITSYSIHYTKLYEFVNNLVRVGVVK